MKTKDVSFWFGILMLLLIGSTAQAQETFTLDANPTLKLSGTSSLHDWEMISNSATGSMVAVSKAGKLDKINSLVIEMPAESIKSGKSGMDKNAYKAINTSSYKTIRFELKQAVRTATGWYLKGNFSLAGVTKEIAVVAKEAFTGGKYTLTGQYSFNLTDYKIDPPTALLGTIKTGDAVKIDITTNFK